MENTALLDKTEDVNEKIEEYKAGYRVFAIIRSLFVYILAIGIIVGALMFAASNSPNKSLFGFRYYTVLTPSMEPVYSVGDMVIVKVADADEINVGDVITFNPSSDGEAHLTHRVIEKLENYNGTGVTCFRTKGDANDTEDTFLLDEDRVIGVVKAGIPTLGYAVRFIQLRWYFVVPLLILLFVFFKLLGVYFAPQEKEIYEEKSKEFDASTDGKPQTTGSQIDDPPNLL